MPFYLYYAQTPELKSLSSKETRDSVHATAWRQLRSEQPVLWLRSFLIFMLFVFVGATSMDRLLGMGGSATDSYAFLGAALGGLIGALLHTHAMATSLRPIYATIIAQRKLAKS